VTVAITLVLLPCCLLLYGYAVYPAILWAMAKLRRKPAGAEPVPQVWPSISVVIPAYNEERQIAGAIEGILAQDYPADRRQILIVSDASSDSTDEIVRSYGDRGVELLRMPVRSGKTAVENAACSVIRGEIVVNSDASIRLHPGAVRRMVANLIDPAVGVASGRDVSVAGDRAANTVEAGYVGYEMRLRRLETESGGIVGASGSPPHSDSVRPQPRFLGAADGTGQRLSLGLRRRRCRVRSPHDLSSPRISPQGPHDRARHGDAFPFPPDDGSDALRFIRLEAHKP
jgi:glycosyltransferase involved in cell wall biosynthesis